MMTSMSAGPRMNRDPAFLADKQRQAHDPQIAPLNLLVEAWRAEGRQVPWADPDSGGVHSRILFLHESPGPAAAVQHGSGFIGPDNDDQTAARFWRLARAAGLARKASINWNAVPWYVSATGRNLNAASADGAEALGYLHQFVSLLPVLRAVVVMGAFAEHLVAALPAPPRKPGGRAHRRPAPQRQCPARSARLRTRDLRRHDQSPPRGRLTITATHETPIASSSFRPDQPRTSPPFCSASPMPTRAAQTAPGGVI